MGKVSAARVAAWWANLPRATLLAAEAGSIELTGMGKCVIIGNNMQRVQVAADAFGLGTFNPLGAGPVLGWFKNTGWMLYHSFNSQVILDIGPIPGQKPYGPWYWMERVLTRLLCE